MSNFPWNDGQCHISYDGQETLKAAQEAVQKHVSRIVHREYAYRRLAAHLLRQLSDARAYLPDAVAAKVDTIAAEALTELDKIAKL